MVNGVDGIRNNLRRDDEVWSRYLMYRIMTWDISDVVDDHSVLLAKSCTSSVLSNYVLIQQMKV
jgi:hypothetical protein